MTYLWETLPREDAGMKDVPAQHVDWVKVATYAAMTALLYGFWYGVIRLAIWVGGVL